MEKNSDIELVKMTLKDAENFRGLMNKYESPLLKFINRLLKISSDEAEDVLQEIFIKTYENLNGFDQDLKFSSWIYRIAYNHSISHYRKNKKNLETLSLEDNEIIFVKLTSETNVKKQAHQNFQKEKVRELLSKLDKKYREVLILKYLEDKDYQEISNILRKPMGTVATLMNRAKNKFKEMLIQNNITI
jgi:RNA polymerase sigma-70 factor, ECF subfamily